MSYIAVVKNELGKITFHMRGITRKEIHKNKMDTVKLIRGWITDNNLSDDRVVLVIHNVSLSLYFEETATFMLGKLRFHNAS